jgi:hypothetical protein
MALCRGVIEQLGRNVDGHSWFDLNIDVGEARFLDRIAANRHNRGYGATL